MNKMVEKKNSIRVCLVGQPNSGKSTLFNEVVGYKSAVANFPGATVEYTEGSVFFLGLKVSLVDLPGVYSLSSLDILSRETLRYLLHEKIDVIVNVVDASVLNRSLELTLQLLELDIPMVLCLNMMDEAERKGIRIHTEKLEEKLGIPVIPTVASKGRGIRDLFWQTLQVARAHRLGKHVRASRDVERIICELVRRLSEKEKNTAPCSPRLLAIKLLECDPDFEAIAKQHYPHIFPDLQKLRHRLATEHGRPSDEVISAERHAISMSMAEQVIVMEKPHFHWKERLDNVLMHNIWGYVFLIGFFILLFMGIFRLGALIEKPLLHAWTSWSQGLENAIGKDTVWAQLLFHLMLGIGGGLAVVIPYLFPFLVALSFFEDLGYLPRIAFLLDGVMHKVGLHGMAVIPIVLGYGCSVPAVMATRILYSPRDRLLASIPAVLVPCSARMTVIFALVGYFLGWKYALALYFINMIVIALVTGLLSRWMPESTPGMILEIPMYRWPAFKTVWIKTWFRLKDFFVYAWPLLILGSAILGMMDFFHWTEIWNKILRPISWFLGLPEKVGVALIFGVLRKELSLLMLFQALGTENVLSVLSKTDVFIYALFTMFYIPCLGTIGMLWKEFRLKNTLLVIAIAFSLALFVSGLARVIVILFG